jgi:hypothetical protein
LGDQHRRGEIAMAGFADRGLVCRGIGNLENVVDTEAE